MGLKDKRQTVAAVNVFKLDKNNMTWEEIEDLKDTKQASFLKPSKFAYLSSFLLKASAFPDQKAPSKYVKRVAVILMFSSLLGTKTDRKNYCGPQQCPRWKLSLGLTHTTVVASPPLVFSESQDDSKRYNLDHLKEDMTLYNTLRNLVSWNVQGIQTVFRGKQMSEETRHSRFFFEVESI
nr:Toll/interleukin-1 receptor (TIR) domain-containing protein [Tanacetum cinerariifolium]